MKIGFRMPGSLGQLPIADLAKWAADNGFGAIDIGAPDKGVVDAIHGAGLEIGTFDLWSTGGLLSPDAEKRSAANKEIKRPSTRSSIPGCESARRATYGRMFTESPHQSSLSTRRCHCPLVFPNRAAISGVIKAFL